MGKKYNVQNRGLSGRLMRIFLNRPGLIQYAMDLVNETGATDPRAVASAISYLRTDTELGKGIDIVARGVAWRYNPLPKPAELAPVQPAAPSPPPKPARRVFEELAVTKAGELLIQDEAGVVYLAKEL